MSHYTPDAYAALLTRTLAPRCPTDSRPRVMTDVTDRGEPLSEFLLPHPTEPRFSVSLEIGTHKGAVDSCTLWFGQAEVSGALEPDEAIPAIGEILDDHIVAIVRYKDKDAYDNRRKASAGFIERLYQLPDDEAELEAMLTRLRRPATLWEKISGTHRGVFEVFRWSEHTMIERM